MSICAPEWGVWWFIQGLVSQQSRTRRFILKGSWDVFGRGAPKDLQPFLQHLLPALQRFQRSVTEGGADRQIWNRVTNVIKKRGEGMTSKSVCWEYLPNRSYPAIGKNDLRLTNTSWTIAKRIKHQLCEKIKWIRRKVWMCSVHKQLTHWNRSTGLLLTTSNEKCCIGTCMNCDSSAPFVAYWGQMDLHTHRRHLHPGYSGSLQNHTQFCFLMEVVKAKSIQSNGDE